MSDKNPQASPDCEEQLEFEFEPQAMGMVQEFHEVFDANLPVDTRVAVIREEIAEVKEAYCHLLKELVDLSYVLFGAEIEGVIDAIPSDVLEEIDTIANLHGFEENITYEAFRRVHESNMSKLGEDGKPIKREDGKILKGPNYKEPDLSDLI